MSAVWKVFRSIRKLAARVARAALRGFPRGTVVWIARGPLKGYRWVMHSGVHTYWLGNYEPETVRILSEWVKPGMVCYDCGANAGYVTMLLKLAGPAEK